jgi:magnesium chelatase family protein
MLARVWSCALAGLEGEPVEVEVDIHHGLPHTTIVGLPDPAVRESKDRLYAALRNAGFRYPMARVTINLAPADVRKAGPAYDLPIALGILAASDQLAAEIDDAVAIGEIALDGSLRFTHGMLPVAAAARAHGFRRILLPAANAAEAALVTGLEVIAADDILTLVMHLSGAVSLPPPPAPDWSAPMMDYEEDLQHVRGQEHARRALEIAAAGGHNLLLTGPPGAGKTMLARCMPSILPPLSLEEALAVTAVYSVAGALPANLPLIRRRPFRSPHHTISNAGLVGGGTWPRPGEISLAHHGVLFLDELPEFDPRVIEVIRQPLEDRVVTIARAAGTATYPASFTLVAARNPCPCGYHGDVTRECTCSLTTIQRYSQRVSGPLLDRIDMHVDVPRVEYQKLVDDQPSEPSAAVRERVVAARTIQRARFAVDEGDGEARVRDSLRFAFNGARRRTTCNGEMTAQEVREHCRVTPEGADLLRAAMRQLGLTGRAFHRVLKLARTIADLEAAAGIGTAHLAEALQYRPREVA